MRELHPLRQVLSACSKLWLYISSCSISGSSILRSFDPAALSRCSHDFYTDLLVKFRRSLTVLHEMAHLGCCRRRSWPSYIACPGGWMVLRTFRCVTVCPLYWESCVRSEWALGVHPSRLPSFPPLEWLACFSHSYCFSHLHPFHQKSLGTLLLLQVGCPFTHQSVFCHWPCVFAFSPVFAAVIPLRNDHNFGMIFTLSNGGCRLWSIVSCVYVVIDVALVVAHGRIVWSESPISIHDELILVDAPSQHFGQCKFVSTRSLFHGYSFLPVGETSDQEGLSAPEIPSKHKVDEIRLLGLSLLWLCW